MSETISDTQLRLQNFVQNSDSSVDLAPGTVLSELLIKLAATLQNPITNSIGTLGQAQAIAAALASTTPTYNPIIDGIGSNYNVTRNQGVLSTGVIQVVVTGSNTLFIPSGFSFVQPVINLSYVTTSAYRVTANPSSATDVQLISQGGLYYFNIPVVAAAVGSQYQVSAGVKFSLTVAGSITNFSDAYAYGNFTSGLPEESDQQFIQRFQAGLTNKTLLTPQSIFARVSQLYPNLRDISVCGGNDPEVTRSKQNIFGLSTLGMADVYVRTSFGPQTIQITKTATQSGGVWSFSLTSADIPAFYRIVSILPSNQGLTGTEINTPTYGFSTAGISPANVVTNVQEGRFTVYQTCNVTFTYASSATSAPFDILLAYQPNIADIQNLMLDSKERIACADYLVKSVMPCYVTVSLQVHQRDPNTSLPVSSMLQDVYNYINSIRFGENLYVSQLVKICHKYDIKYVDFPITVYGNILGNDSSVTQISSTDVLAIPTNLEVGISPKTTLFFADYFNSGASNVYNNNNMSQSISITVI